MLTVIFTLGSTFAQENDARATPKCKNPKGDLYSIIHRSGCKQAVCSRKGKKKAEWVTCPAPVVKLMKSEKRELLARITDVVREICGGGATLSCSCGMKKPKQKIVGGSNADANEYPWIVALFFGESLATVTMHCAGTILNSKWIITARHCLYKNYQSEPSYSPSETFVYFGEHDLSGISSGNGVRAEVEEIVMSPTPYDDYALIKLKNSIDLQKHTPICLPSEGDEFRGMTATFTGWGSTTNMAISEISGSNTISNPLQEIDLPISTSEVCEEHFVQTYGVPAGTPLPNILCFGGDEDKNACFSDNGAPIIVQKDGEERWTLAGIISGMSDPCADEDSYGHGLNAVNFLHHITTTISSDAKFCDA